MAGNNLEEPHLTAVDIDGEEGVENRLASAAVLTGAVAAPTAHEPQPPSPPALREPLPPSSARRQ